MRITKRRLLLLLLSLPLTALLLFLLWYARDQRAPPSSHLRRPVPAAEELSSLRSNSSASYVLFNQLRGAGFNNQLQESLLLSHIAARAGRAYVYRDVIWRPRGYDTVPAEVFFSSPVTSPPAVHEKVFDALCAGQEVREVDTWGPHEGRVSALVQALEGDEQCARVTNRVMDWRFLESDAALALYEPLLPHMRTFAWSPGVQAAYTRAVSSLNLRSGRYMALHLRRGDFYYHCPEIAREKSAYNLWSRLPFLPDALPQRELEEGTVLEHCWPDYFQILDKILQTKEAYERRTGVRLESVYVLHDAKWDAPWVWILVRWMQWQLGRAPFKLRFVDAAWLPLRWEEKDLGIAVDMEIARRAEVFVGNAFSSLTSNVVLLRLADGREWESIRFW
ncbi:hypothetical protein CALVIDRAFT_517065 [Calocera viscosa TUFC12733]|uniref:Glycosyltransferase family 23 protein n=1 Tax=Calocera viscosa (strain TUFC12733) TaxID=1330018 RepID=A0A167KGH8_CALVF|nr:hypothetical protein CALVIDRAFT_517065 [Calocera viscosa TUFC12733]